MRTPIRWPFGDCCPSATSGPARMLPPTMVMNARRSISLYSPDDLVGADENRLRDGQAEGFGRLEVDDQLELRGLLDWKISRSSALEHAIDKRSNAPVVVSELRCVRAETACINKGPPGVERRKPMLHHKSQDIVTSLVHEECRRHYDTARAHRFERLERPIKVIDAPDLHIAERHIQRSGSPLQLCTNRRSMSRIRWI